MLWLLLKLSSSNVARRNLFYGGRGKLSKYVGHDGWSSMKNFKITLAKTSKNSPKKCNLNQKINYSYPHIWRLSFNFRLSIKKSQRQQKLVKKIIHLTISFQSKSITYFTNLSSLNFVKNILTQHNRKLTHFTNFPTNFPANICTAPFLDAQELHSRNTRKVNVCIFLYISVRSFISVRNISLKVGWKISWSWLIVCVS